MDKKKQQSYFAYAVDFANYKYIFIFDQQYWFGSHKGSPLRYTAVAAAQLDLRAR